MSKDVVVSFCISSFNRRDIVEALVLNILSLSNEQIEVVVVDDHSDDGTKECLEKIADSRFRFIQKEVREGASSCWYDALENGNGKWLFQLLDRDWIDVSQIELLVQTLLDLEKENVAFAVAGERLSTGEKVYLCREGKETIREFAFRFSHPSGQIFRKSAWDSLNDKRKYFVDENYGIYPHGYLYAILGNIYKGAYVLFDICDKAHYNQRVLKTVSKVYSNRTDKKEWFWPESRYKLLIHAAENVELINDKRYIKEFMLRKYADFFYSVTSEWYNNCQNEILKIRYGRDDIETNYIDLLTNGFDYIASFREYLEQSNFWWADEEFYSILCGVDQDLIQWLIGWTNKLRMNSKVMEQYIDCKNKCDSIHEEAEGLLESLSDIQLYLMNNSGEKAQNVQEKEDLLNLVVEACFCLRETIAQNSNKGKCFDDLTNIIQKLMSDMDGDAKIQSVIEFDFESVELVLEQALSDKMRECSSKISNVAWEQELKAIQKEMRYHFFGNNNFDKAYEREIAFLKEKGTLALYPYPFTEKYSEEKISVYWDEKNGHKYVIHNGKKLYFPPRTDDSIRHEYNQLILEQDMDSPHAYFSEQCGVRSNGIFVDVGSAEGIIAIDVIDQVSEVYLIECSEEWIKALQLTFSGYEEKVHYIKKYAGRYDSEDTVSLDTLLKSYSDKEIFIKMDVEGMELDVLKGAKNIIRNNRCCLSCASYHTELSENKIKEFFEKNDYMTENSKGFMLFYYGHMVMLNGKYSRQNPPYFRRAIVRAWKNESC